MPKTKKKKRGRPPKTEKKTEKKTIRKKIDFKQIIAFLKDEKVRFLFGLIMLFFAAYVTIAFFSFLFTWEIDQSRFELNFFEYMFSSEIEVENWMGKFGAFLSKIFIYKWFGIPAFGLIFIIILFGLRKIKVIIPNLKKYFRYTIFATIWLSLTLSFLFGDSYFNLGGAYGYLFVQWLSGIIGKFGAGFLIFFTALTFVFFTFDNSFAWLNVFFKNFSFKKNIKTTFNETNETIKSTYQQTEKNKENSNNTLFNKTETDNKQKLHKTIDLDTNEVIETVDKKNFLLNDSGKTIDKDNDLGFEIKKTADIEEDFEQESKKLDDKLHDRHALEVQKNKDIHSEQIEQGEDFDPTLELSTYKFPTLELLLPHKVSDSEVTNEELIENKNKIVETLLNYKIKITKIKATIGPTITLYEIIPAPGIRISKIKNLEDDIALSLAALGIRIIAPMPGRGTIGIEVPNQKPAIVSMKSVVSSSNFQNSKYDLPIVLGKTISNESYVFDLTKMPHLLVAGATGQGKSVGLNAIIASILYKKHPSQVKFILIDPKKVELVLYERLEKHFLAKLPDSEEAIITENKKVIHTLNSLNKEMDTRYRLLKAAKVRNIKEYNVKFIARKLNPEKGHHFMPFLVLIIDEFADLIMTAGKEVELPIARLAQLARAIGIHLIVATQRPSTNIITGTIKANFPARVAFKVASMIDSRTILDSPGANQLIGRGDMLITNGSDLIRLQCAFIDTPELDNITEFIGEQRGFASAFELPEPDLGDDEAKPGDVDLSKRDSLFDDAARIIVMNQQGSTSLIQRKLAIGYNRAGRIMDQIEAAGIVGPAQGSKAREVFIVDDHSLEHLLNSLDKM